MNNRISPTKHLIYHHSKLMEEFNGFMLNINTAIKDGTGVPSTLGNLNFLEKAILKALEDEHEQKINRGNKFALEIREVKANFERLRNALKDFRPVSMSHSEANRFTSKIYDALSSFNESGVKY